ncbi:MAG: hypothetical protein ACOCP8_08580 [archaeon]
MNQKLLQKSIKKAYLQIDVIFIILVFFTLFFVVHGIVFDNIVGYEKEFQQNKLSLDAKDVCILLTQSSGNPHNWEILGLEDVDFFGLKQVGLDGLDDAKILAFNNSNYYQIINKFNINSYFNVRIVGLETNNVYLNFIDLNLDHDNILTGNYVCYSNYNSEIVEVQIETWN